MIIDFREKIGNISGTIECLNCMQATVVYVYRVFQNNTVGNTRRIRCGNLRSHRLES